MSTAPDPADTAPISPEVPPRTWEDEMREATEKLKTPKPTAPAVIPAKPATSSKKV